MFKDTKDGSTHYYNDGCGEPAHNDKEQPKECEHKRKCAIHEKGIRCRDCGENLQPKEEKPNYIKRCLEEMDKQFPLEHFSIGFQLSSHPTEIEFKLWQKKVTENAEYTKNRYKQFLEKSLTESYERGIEDAFKLNKCTTDFIARERTNALQEYKEELNKWIGENTYIIRNGRLDRTLVISPQDLTNFINK